jgi:hypothetical protein
VISTYQSGIVAKEMALDRWNVMERYSKYRLLMRPTMRSVELPRFSAV